MKKRLLSILSIMACMSLSVAAPAGVNYVCAEEIEVETSEDADVYTEDGAAEETDGASDESSTEEMSEEEQIADYYSFYTDPWIEAWFSGDKSALDSVDSQYGVTNSYAVDDSAYKALVSEAGDRVSDEKAVGTASEDGMDVTITRKVKCVNKTLEFVFSFSSTEQTFSWTVEAEATTSEVVAKAGLNTLMGMGTVFVVLIFISFVISLFKLFSKVGTKKEDNSPAPAPAQAEVEKQEVTVQTESDDEIIAVISAAIAAYEEEMAAAGEIEVPADGLIVRSVRKRRF